VPEFVRWRNLGAKVLGNQDLPALDARMDNVWVELEVEGVQPGRFMKHVVTILLAIAPGGFAETNPELVEYARDPDKVGLPAKYKLYLALYAGPVARLNGGTIRVLAGPDGLGPNVMMLEVAYPPFAYVMTIDEPESSVEACDVTNLTEIGIDVETQTRMTLPFAFGHTMYPADFRTKARWQKERAENEPEVEPAR
jgi:hypothetical protein